MDSNETIVFPHPKESDSSHISMAGANNAGRNHPENQDTGFMIDSNNKTPFSMFAVFDGMGGHTGGLEAARTARDTILERIKINRGKIDPNFTLDQTKDFVKSMIMEADAVTNDARASSGHSDMGTTGTLGLIRTEKDGSQKLVVGNVGDSSMHILRNGSLTKLTVDDDLAHLGKGNVLTQSLGEGNAKPRIGVFDLYPGDQIVAITDGVSDALGANLNAEFAKALRECKGNPSKAAESLVNKARDYANSGKKEDDRTSVVVEIADNKPAIHKQPKKEAEKAYRLTNGTMVNVKRSDGRIEDGWYIVGTTTSGNLKLRNPDGLVKSATPEQLDTINPPIEKVTTWDGFLFAINQLHDGISKDAICKTLNRYMNGEARIEEVTSAFGIQAKAYELGALARARKNLGRM